MLMLGKNVRTETLWMHTGDFNHRGANEPNWLQPGCPQTHRLVSTPRTLLIFYPPIIQIFSVLQPTCCLHGGIRFA